MNTKGEKNCRIEKTEVKPSVPMFNCTIIAKQLTFYLSVNWKIKISMCQGWHEKERDHADKASGIVFNDILKYTN